MADNEHRLLRRYIKESLVTEIGVGDTIKKVGKVLGISGGPEKWFSDFLDDQLDDVGKKINDWLGDKLINALPSEVSAEVEKFAKKEGETSSSALTKVVTGWIEEFEEFAENELSSAEKKAIYEFALEEYSGLLKKDANVKKALIVVKRKIDEKFGRSTMAPGNVKYLQKKKEQPKQ